MIIDKPQPRRVSITAPTLCGRINRKLVDGIGWLFVLRFTDPETNSERYVLYDAYWADILFEIADLEIGGRKLGVLSPWESLERKGGQYDKR